MANAPRRSQTLDILRAVAVLLVIGRHMDVCPAGTNSVLNRLTFYWHQGGWIGVDVFFVLSGFLVSGLLFKEHQRDGTFSVRNFLLRRGLKIYPAFWVLILFTALFNGLVRRDLDGRALLHEIFFVQNYAACLWNHTWSLAVEEHFYLLLPTALYLMIHQPKEGQIGATDPFQRLPLLFCIVAVICLALRCYTAATRPFDFLTDVFPTHLRIDSLLFGVLLSYGYHYHRDTILNFVGRCRPVLFVLGIGALIPMFLLPIETTPWVYTVGFTLCYLGAGMILLALIGYEPKPTPLPLLVAFLGSLSYSIYLWHMPAEITAKAIQRRLGAEDGHWFLYAAVYMIGAIVLGIVMAQIIELPVLKLRDRFFPSRSQAVPAG
jgi:peptidoglycan/LPS O-acetylase OafA/YrhL